MAETNLGRVAIVPQGNYSASVRYYYLDLVFSDGNTYVAISDPPIGTSPTNATYWQLVATGGSPKGVYATLAALQAAFPTGTTGIYVTSDNGHWYFWSGSAWTDGGAYKADLTIKQTTGTSTTDVMSQNAVSNEIDSIILKTNNLYKLENRISGKYIIGATGVQTDNAAFSFFRVNVTPEAYYFMENDLSATSQDGAYFDINNNYLSEILSFSIHTATIDKKRFAIKPPANAAYALINIVNAAEAATPIVVYNTIEQLVSELMPLEQLTKNSEIFIRDVVTTISQRGYTNGYIRSDGALVVNAVFGYIPTFKVKGGDVISVSNYTGSYAPSAISSRGVYLDEDFKLLSYIDAVDRVSPSYIVPSGAHYAIINYIATEANNIQIKIIPQSTTSYRLRKECIYPPLSESANGYFGKKWVSFGDSITFQELWQPYIISEYGLNHINLGIGSTCMINAGSTPMCSTARIDAIKAESPDIVTILAGANDLVYSEGGTSAVTGAGIGDATEFAKALGSKDLLKFYGAYSFVIETLLAWKPTLRIIILGTTWAHADGTAYNTLITYTDFSNASKAIAQYYGLPFVDLHGESGFNKLTIGNAPYNIYSDDNIHPNAAGAKRIAEVIMGRMKDIMPI